jgi:Helix-turn-helix domain
MNAVWRYSRQKGGKLLVLLAIADYAHDDGTGAFPSVPTIARKARMTERSVQRCLRSLERDGELRIREGAGPNGVNMYVVTVGDKISPGDKKTPGDGMSHGDASVTGGVTPRSPGGVTPTSPDPSLEPSVNRQPAGADGDKKAKTKTTKTTWPADLALTPEMREYAIGHGIANPDLEFEKFHNKALAKGYKNVDWTRAWYNWCTSPYQEPSRNGHVRAEALTQTADEYYREATHDRPASAFKANGPRKP